MVPKDNGALLLNFDRFWVDLGADSLRWDVAAGEAAGGGRQGQGRACACARAAAGAAPCCCAVPRACDARLCKQAQVVV